MFAVDRVLVVFDVSRFFLHRCLLVVLVVACARFSIEKSGVRDVMFANHYNSYRYFISRLECSLS